MHLSCVHTLILFAGLAYGQVDAVPSGTETDMPGAGYLFSLSNFEASVSSYLVGAPSAIVSAVTESNAGTEAVKSGTPTSATFTGSMTATLSTPPSSEEKTLTTKPTATVVSGISSSASGMTTSSGVAGTSSETATAVTVSTTAGTASGSAAAKTEKTTSTTSASASPTGSTKNAADMVHGFVYGAGIVLLAVVLGGF